MASLRAKPKYWGQSVCVCVCVFSCDSFTVIYITLKYTPGTNVFELDILQDYVAGDADTCVIGKISSTCVIR